MPTTYFLVSTAAELDAALASIDVGGANAAAATSYQITIADDLIVGSNLPAINLIAGDSLVITGNSGVNGNPTAVLDGNGAARGFVVEQGAVTLDSLGLDNFVSAGQAGGAGVQAGGGGAGLGGAVFVGANASVVLSNDTFVGDAAVGGAGGHVSGSGVGAGGAGSPFGLFGNGGAGGVGGGFGGGGGSGAAGGFGAGSNGGGGLGAGGNVFVQQGGSLTISGGALGSGTASGGAAGAGGAGAAYGSGIFIQGDDAISLANVSVTGVVADGAGSGGAGVGAVDVSGAVTLGAADTFTGGVYVAGSSSLTLTQSKAAGSGAIHLSSADQLQIGHGVAPANAIDGFTDAGGSTIDLQGFGLATQVSLLAGNHLVVKGTSSVTLNLDPTVNYAQDSFLLSSDGAGGTLVRVAQTTFVVANEAQLDAAIQAIDVTGAQAQPNARYTITFAGDITLSDDLYALDLGATDQLTINGAGHALDGVGKTRGLFVYAGKVGIQNLTIENAVATGGAGGSGLHPGGGGAGLGGGLFVGPQGAVALSGVQFLNDAAVGGAAGALSASGWGGGGGLGGAGGAGASGGESGGGGIGAGAIGGSGASKSGGGGILLGAGGASGGSGTHSGSGGPGAGGANGGGGGWGNYFSGGGGRGGGRSTPGEGGSGGRASAGNWGGGAGSGRAAGFGGGGSVWAGGPKGSPVTTSANGGFGGGAAAGGVAGWGAGTAGGGAGGGLGAGGAIFVAAGGSLSYGAGAISGDTASGGAGSGGGGAGSGVAGGLFLSSGVTRLNPAAGQTLAIGDAIADFPGGASALVVAGPGAVTLSASNSYSGGTLLSGGSLTLAAPGAAGSGRIVFAYASPATLTLGAGDIPNNVIADFAPGDAIDLLGVALETGAHLGAGNALALTGGAVPVSLHLDPLQTYANYTFQTADDHHGGTLLTVSTPGNAQPPLITGAKGKASGFDNAALNPFAGLTVLDANAAAIETAQVTLSTTANGAFTNLGAGNYNSATGVYTVTGTAAAVTAALKGLTFQPKAHEVVPGAIVLTGATIAVSDGVLGDIAKETLSITAANTAPLVDAMPASFQSGYFTVAINPFATAKVVDPDVGASETATITLSSSAAPGFGSDVNGVISLAGPVDGVSLAETAAGSGVYTLSAGSPAALTAALQAIQFTPSYNASGFTITDMSVAISDGTATTTTSTSVLAGAPVIAGAVAGQTTLDTKPLKPFAAVKVTDSPEFASEQVTIFETDAGSSLQGDVNGLLSGPGLAETFAGSGAYTLTAGTPAQVTAALEALTFTPHAHQGLPGTTIATDFEISVFNGASTSNNYGAGVIAAQT